MDAPWTAVHNTPNKSIRQDVPRKGVVLHHAALTSIDYLRRLAMGEKQVSATNICKDNTLELMIVEYQKYRPWSLSSAYWDSALRSVETANDSVNGWTISDQSHWSLARMVAYWALNDGFWPHRDGNPSTWTVIGHREVHTIHNASYATACPGGMDIGLVVRRAQAILNGQQLQEEDTMELIIITQDAGADGGPTSTFASQAIIHPIIGWKQTSVGRGSRSETDAYRAIANNLGMTVREESVDVAGWFLSQRFTIPTVNAGALAGAVVAGITPLIQNIEADIDEEALAAALPPGVTVAEIVAGIKTQWAK